MSNVWLSDANAAARLSGLLDSAMDAIISVDDQLNVVLYNRAAERAFGWSPREVLGRPLDLLLPERFRGAHGQQMRRFGATGTTSRRMGDNTVLHALRKDGTEFPIEASISQLQTPEGKLYTVILRDVSERVRAREELAAFAAESSGVREQEKSRIARELHDELAQSITALKMDTTWLRDQVGSADAKVQEKIGHMLGLLDSTVAAMRRIASDLRPLVLDDLGLVPAIECSASCRSRSRTWRSTRERARSRWSCSRTATTCCCACRTTASASAPRRRGRPSRWAWWGCANARTCCAARSRSTAVPAPAPAWKR
jgi:PAS domain S-box-containing protein